MRLGKLGMGMLVGSALFAMSASAEDYKTYRPTNSGNFGIAGGFGLVDTTGGGAFIAHGAFKVSEDGFVPEIVNPVFFELEFGPLFSSGTTLWMYSGHLRWDFVKDSVWTLYALGGIGGNFFDNKLGDRFAIHPRFGVGTFYAMTETVQLRTEFSHELVTVGVSVPF